MVLFLALLSLPGLPTPCSAQNRDLRVRNIRVLQGSGKGGRVSWSKARNIIAYDRLGANGGFYDVWTINPDGSGDTCLTCGIAALGTKNKGNPDWHPSGNFLAIQVQKQGGEGPVADEIGLEVQFTGRAAN